MAATLANEKMGKEAVGFIQDLFSRAGQLQGIKFLKKNQTPSETRLSGTDAPSKSGGGDLFRIAKIDNADAGRTLELLREKEKQFRDLYDNAPVAYFSVKADDGSILNCNLAAQRLSGYSKKNLIGMKVFDLYADTEHGLLRAKEVFKRFKAGEAIQDVELQIKNRAGKLVWVSLSVEPVRDQDDKTIRSRSILVDISGRKRVAEALRRAHEGVKEQVEQRTSELAKANQQLKQEIEERKQIEAELTEAHDELEQRVEARTLELMEAAGELQSKHKELLHHKKELEKVNRELVDTNKALSVLARNIDRKREEAEKKMSLGISSKILPLIEGLKNDKSLKNLEADLDMLIASLNELTPGLRNGASIIYSLSSTELRVATMIKNGLTSPEIARLLHVSLDTIKTHRRSIRRKLNISNSKINTASFLRLKMA